MKAIATPRVLEHLLQESSRTFALTIPRLGEPTRCEVTVAYLLFRVADTIEDATEWTRERKSAALEEFARFVEAPSEAEAARLAATWTADPPIRHHGYRELLGELPAVTRAALGLAPEAWRIVSEHTRRTAIGMAGFVRRERNGLLELRDEDDLEAYCYTVAGIVGEMLTELFLARGPSLEPVAPLLRRDAPAFGEALQLVNILRDAAADSDEGRRFLPAGVEPAAVLARARRDLDTASEYCARLEANGADRGVLGFTALPILLARATLRRVEIEGAGAKISRVEVSEIVRSVDAALEAGRVAPLLEDARAGGARSEVR